MMKNWLVFQWGRILKNFRGRNEQVGFGFSTGGLNMIAFAYSNPWITGDHVSFSSDIVKNQYDHPFILSTVEIQSLEMNIGDILDTKENLLVLS